MNTLTHIAVNTAISFPMKYVFNCDLPTVFIFMVVGGILIDIDHLLFLTFKHKTINPKKWILIGKKMRSKMQPGLYIFHSPEFNILLLLLSLFNEIAWVVFLSNFVHITLDIVEHYKYHGNFIWMKNWSITYSLTH